MDPQPTGGGQRSSGDDRAAKWHAEHDTELRQLLRGIAFPHTLGPISAQDGELISWMLKKFEECAPAITDQDVIGLVVLRFTQEFLPEGEVTGLGVDLATKRALAFVIKAEPERMREAGFTVPDDELSNVVSECEIWAASGCVQERWKRWHLGMMDPSRSPRDDREAIVRGLARLFCFRQAADEILAAKQAWRQLDADLRRQGHGGTNLDPEDIIQELYALEPGSLGKTRILRLRKDGHLDYRERAIRDSMRLAKHRAGEKLEDMENMEDVVQASSARTADSAREELELAELRARLVDGADEIDMVILDQWDEKNSVIGEELGISGQAVGKRRKDIRERAKRLDQDREE